MFLNCVHNFFRYTYICGPEAKPGKHVGVKQEKTQHNFEQRIVSSKKKNRNVDRIIPVTKKPNTKVASRKWGAL